ncbi:MAG: hypothetical protein MUE58_08575 [Chitinophagaceae bacterium]|jgi:hypothetical protein|nr:hypothetical protein [Chitinophagaceae bacterium]
MKKVWLYALFAVMVACTGSCSDKPDMETTELSPDEVVTLRISFVAAICGDAICKIEDPEYLALGQRGFRYEGKTYDGVFMTTIPCGPDVDAFSNIAADRPTVFRVRISKNPFSDVNYSCVRCAATFAEGPSVRYYIRPE